LTADELISTPISAGFFLLNKPSSPSTNIPLYSDTYV
jgi:hypothetical protein